MLCKFNVILFHSLFLATPARKAVVKQLDTIADALQLWELSIIVTGGVRTRLRVLETHCRALSHCRHFQPYNCLTLYVIVMGYKLPKLMSYYYNFVRVGVLVAFVGQRYEIFWWDGKK